MATRKVFLSLCAIGAAAIVAATFAGDPPKFSREEVSKQLAPLLKERRDILGKLVKIRTQQYQVGAGPFEEVAAATDQLFDADLELAATRAERIAVCEKKVSALLANEKWIQVRFQNGFHHTEGDLLEAKVARLKAEAQLVREKASEK